MNIAASLDVDLSQLPLGDFDRMKNPKTKKIYYNAHLDCRMILSGTSLDIQVYCNNKKICQTTLQDIETSRTKKLKSKNLYPPKLAAEDRRNQVFSSLWDRE